MEDDNFVQVLRDLEQTANMYAKYFNNLNVRNRVVTILCVCMHVSFVHVCMYVRVCVTMAQKCQYVCQVFQQLEREKPCSVYTLYVCMHVCFVHACSVTRAQKCQYVCQVFQ